MQTSRQLITAMAEKKGWNNARIAKTLRENREVVSLIRAGQQCLTESHAQVIAKVLELDHLYVLACVRAESAKRKGLKSMWERIARGANAIAVTLWLYGSVELFKQGCV